MLRALALALALSAASFAAASEIKVSKLATGEVLVHAYQNGVPLPAESKWMLCSGAGPSFVPEDGRHRLNWVVHLKDKRAPAEARAIVRVKVQEVSGPVAVPVFDGPPRTTDKGLMIIAPEQLTSRDNYPWLYTAEGTMFILRVTLEAANGEQDVLVQPVLIGAGVKRTLRTSGILFGP